MIAGSHKIDPTVDTAEIIEAAIADPSLIHHVVAPAGSTLVFFESTIHACAKPPPAPRPAPPSRCLQACRSVSAPFLPCSCSFLPSCWRGVAAAEGSLA